MFGVTRSPDKNQAARLVIDWLTRGIEKRGSVLIR